MNYITSVGYYIDKKNGVCWSKGYLKRNLNSSMEISNEQRNEQHKKCLITMSFTQRDLQFHLVRTKKTPTHAHTLYIWKEQARLIGIHTSNLVC